MKRGEKIYAPDEWWTFDLAMDFLVALSCVDGIDVAVKSDLASKVNVFDGHWSGIVEKSSKHAKGPTPLQPFRSVIPRRSA